MVSMYATVADLLAGKNPLDRSKVLRYGPNRNPNDQGRETQGTSFINSSTSEPQNTRDYQSDLKQTSKEKTDKTDMSDQPSTSKDITHNKPLDSKKTDKNQKPAETGKRLNSESSQRDDEPSIKKNKSSSPERNFRYAKSTTNRRKTRENETEDEINARHKSSYTTKEETKKRNKTTSILDNEPNVRKNSASISDNEPYIRKKSASISEKESNTRKKTESITENQRNMSNKTTFITENNETTDNQINHCSLNNDEKTITSNNEINNVSSAETIINVIIKQEIKQEYNSNKFEANANEIQKMNIKIDNVRSLKKPNNEICSMDELENQTSEMFSNNNLITINNQMLNESMLVYDANQFSNDGSVFINKQELENNSSYINQENNFSKEELGQQENQILINNGSVKINKRVNNNSNNDSNIYVKQENSLEQGSQAVKNLKQEKVDDVVEIDDNALNELEFVEDTSLVSFHSVYDKDEIFVSNLCQSTTVILLCLLFQKYGHVLDVKFINTPGVKSAIIKFEHCESANRALEKNGEVWNGRHLIVNFYGVKWGKEPHSVEIYNITSDVDREDLWRTFECCGKIKRIFIYKKTRFGDFRGTVVFQSAKAVSLALKMQPFLYGRLLTVRKKLCEPNSNSNNKRKKV